ncbi:MAG: hypothetical protein V4559_10805 [Pseudomonadota bacterium]
MTNRIFSSAAAIALIMLGAPAFAQMSSNMPMNGMPGNSTPATTANKVDKASPTDGAKEPMSMKGMDMSSSSKVAGNEKHRCMMHMTRTSMSMSMSNGNHHCMMRKKKAMGPM